MVQKTKATEYTPCMTPACDREAEHKESQLCKRCYAFQYYWTGRSVTDRMKRVRTLEYWNERAHTMLMPRQVASISRAKKKRA